MEAYSVNSEPETTIPDQEGLPGSGRDNTPLTDKNTGTARRGALRPKSKMPSNIKTLLLSVAYVFWHFGNFMLLEDDKGKLFFFSFFLMVFIYGKTVLTKWFKTIVMVVISVLVQNIGLLCMFPVFKKMSLGKVSHWDSMVYASYHLVAALVMAACAIILFAVLERIGKLLKRKV